ncbi:unnamed protein product [Closterium sp. Naga37s-1]|nr:unnamed protein product [Closterium sp. Naga37s-1]
MVVDMIRAVAEYLGRSGSWHQRFMELQEVFTATNFEVQGIHEIRWLSRGAAVAQFVEVLLAIVVMLSEWKDQIMYELITSYRFQFLLRFLADVRELLNVLSKVFQQREEVYDMFIGQTRHHHACVALWTDMAELLVQNLQAKLGDLDYLSSVRLFILDLWQPNWERHARQAQCLEWLLSLVTLFRVDDSDEILPG